MSEAIATEADPGVTEKWRYETKDYSNFPGYVSSSPTVVNGAVYVGSGYGNVLKLDAETGAKQWAYDSGPINFSSPTVVGGTLYIGSSGCESRACKGILALDEETGEEQWYYQTDDYVMSSPTVSGDTVFVGSHDRNIYAFEKDSGDRLWTFESGGEVRSSPTVVDGNVYFGSNDGSVYALDESSGERAWSFETGGSIETSSPTVSDGTVFIGGTNNRVYALDSATGTPQWDFNTGGSVEGSPTVADGRVYIGNDALTVYGLDATTGDKQWEFQASGSVNSSPTYVNDLIVVGGRYLQGIHAGDGGSMWTFETGDFVFSSPTVLDGTVFVGSQDGNVYALDVETPGSSEGSRVRQRTLGHHGLSDGGNTPPTTEFVYSPSEPSAGDTITFDASASNDSDGSISSYEWDVDDDGTFEKTGVTITHTYDSGGDKPVILRTTDDDGAANETKKTISVAGSTDGPTALFNTTSTVGPPFETGVDIEFDASDSSDPDGSIAAYDWDLDGDGRYDRSGKMLSHTYDIPGENNVTLRVTDNDGNTDTVSETISVRLAGTTLKLDTAGRIDDHSVLSVIESNSDIELDGDKEVTQATIDALEASVKDGTIDPAVAEAAITRLQALEDASLFAVDRLGPKGGTAINIAEETAKMTISWAVTLLFFALSLAAAPGAVGGATGVAAGAVVTAVTAAVSHFLGDMLESDENGETRTKQLAEQRCREEAQGIVDEIKNGALSGAEAIRDRIDQAVDNVVDLIADGIRAVAELDRVEAVIGTPTGNPYTDLLGTGTSIYGALKLTDDAMQPEQVAGGLQGTTVTATSALNTALSELETTINDASDLLTSVQAASAEINLYESAEDLLNGDESVVQQFIEGVTALANAFRGGVMTVLQGVTSLAGYTLIAWIKTIHGQMAEAAIKGQEVSFVNV